MNSRTRDDHEATLRQAEGFGIGWGPPRTPVDHERIQRAVREMLFAVGEDPDREGLEETPARVARMYAEVFRGVAPGRTTILAKNLYPEARRDGSRQRHRVRQLL